MQATLKADEVRQHFDLDMFQPINVFDACIELGITVTFVNINMEGMYIKKNGRRPTILLSNQRPIPRRFYTCAHELGHHVFNHGTKIDGLNEQTSGSSHYDHDELLVDTFAGALLMPVAGVQAEFVKRNWNIKNATPIQFYIVCSVFGTGYQSLITHCKFNKLISVAKADSLLTLTPSKILEGIFPSHSNNSHFKIIDSESELSTIDLEVSNYIFLPKEAVIEGDHLQFRQETYAGTAYSAVKPGIVRVTSSDGSINSYVRIQNFQYSGHAEYRHLEDSINNPIETI